MPNQDDEFKDLLSGLNFDVGGLFGGDAEEDEIPDLFRVDADEYDQETKYLRPKRRSVKAADYVCYDNAKKLARNLKLYKGGRFDAIVGGNFIFGDFIEAYLTAYNIKCTEMSICTLSMSQDNVDSLANLINAGYIDKLSLFISVYFYAHERNILIPYLYSKLDTDKCDFQMSVTDIHCKIAQFNTLGGKHVVCHGSANLRSSGNIEQMTIEENEELYNFYSTYFAKIEDEYKTIKKPIRVQRAWKAIKDENT